jgi:hypothetical protein
MCANEIVTYGESSRLKQEQLLGPMKCSASGAGYLPWFRHRSVKFLLAPELQVTGGLHHTVLLVVAPATAGLGDKELLAQR